MNSDKKHYHELLRAKDLTDLSAKDKNKKKDNGQSILLYQYQ